VCEWNVEGQANHVPVAVAPLNVSPVNARENGVEWSGWLFLFGGAAAERRERRARGSANEGRIAREWQCRVRVEEQCLKV